MKHIISIQSHVAYGHVGNCAAVFPLQRLGWDVIPVNTVQFSNHTGYEAFTGQVFSAAHVRDVIAGVQARTGFADVSAVVSGYLGDRSIGEVVLQTVAGVKQRNPQALYCCDPVMGDPDGSCIVSEDIPGWIRTNAVAAADIMTPNIYELSRLTNQALASLDDVQAACGQLRAAGPRVVLCTSLTVRGIGAGQVGMLVDTAEGCWTVETPQLQLPRLSGTGDVTAAVFLASCLAHGIAGDGPARALGKTASALHRLLLATEREGGREIALIAAQDDFVAATAADVEVVRLR